MTAAQNRRQVTIASLPIYFHKYVVIELVNINSVTDSYILAMGKLLGMKARLDQRNNRYALLIFEGFEVEFPYHFETPWYQPWIQEIEEH